VKLASFSLEGAAKKNLRNMNNRYEKEGYVFSVETPASVPALLPELKEISDGWLKEKNAREKGFSLGSFKEDYLKNFPVALARKGNSVVVFSNLWLGGDKEEMSIDMMRYRPDAPSGIMDYFFIRMMTWGREPGFHWFNLGMAPLAGVPNHPLAPIWNKISGLVFRHGENFYNFEGLRHYKDKFDPVWEPRYLAAPPGLPLPRVIANVTSLIGGGLKGVLGK
jgi:phosphatidylglycerol lysyltransferase